VSPELCRAALTVLLGWLLSAVEEEYADVERRVMNLNRVTAVLPHFERDRTEAAIRLEDGVPPQELPPAAERCEDPGIDGLAVQGVRVRYRGVGETVPGTDARVPLHREEHLEPARDTKRDAVPIALDASDLFTDRS
jgi:hypothetical protein